jgi:hypothetical protein
MEGLMCWIPLTLGVVMIGGGAFLIIRFFVGRGSARPEVATMGRTESMIVGALLASVGFLMLVLGITGVICQGLGIG